MTELIEEIKKIVLEVLKIPDINANDSPETIMEWDSFAQIVFFSMFSKKLNVKFQDHEILNFYTYSELIDLVKMKCKD
jgi:acyl carrier protein